MSIIICFTYHSDEQLHTNSQHHRLSTSVIHQSAEVDRSMVTQASERWYSIYVPRRDGRLSGITWTAMVVSVLLLRARRPGIRCQTAFVTKL